MRLGRNAIDGAFLRRRVPQGNFVLVIEPILIVRPQAGVKNPLLKTQIGRGQIIGNWPAIERAGMPGEMRNIGDDLAPPLMNNPHGLAGEDFAGGFQLAVMIGGHADGDFQLRQFSKRDGGGRDSGRAVRILRDGFGDEQINPSAQSSHPNCWPARKYRRPVLQFVSG